MGAAASAPLASRRTRGCDDRLCRDPIGNTRGFRVHWMRARKSRPRSVAESRKGESVTPQSHRVAVGESGVEIRVLDWGGQGPLALLHHANGFCAATWGLVAARLTPRSASLAATRSAFSTCRTPASWARRRPPPNERRAEADLGRTLPARHDRRRTRGSRERTPGGSLPAHLLRTPRLLVRVARIRDDP